MQPRGGQTCNVFGRYQIRRRCHQSVGLPAKCRDSDIARRIYRHRRGARIRLHQNAEQRDRFANLVLEEGDVLRTDGDLEDGQLATRARAAMDQRQIQNLVRFALAHRAERLHHPDDINGFVADAKGRHLHESGRWHRSDDYRCTGWWLPIIHRGEIEVDRMGNNRQHRLAWLSDNGLAHG